MDELPPKTPMTPGVGPRFGLEEETSFAGNTAPTVVSSEGTSTVAERLWRAKVAKTLQKGRAKNTAPWEGGALIYIYIYIIL